jgi:hypothetical protein
MNIELKKITLDIENGKKDLDFEKLYENSYKEAIKKQAIREKEKIKWSGIFSIENEEIELEFAVDTEGNYLTYLDLDGYLNGEVAEIDDGSALHLISEKSNVYEAICFMEIKKLKILPEKKLKALEYSLFPKFAKGYIANDLAEDTNVADFMDIFAPILSELELIKKINIGFKWVSINGGDEETQKRFKIFLEDYLGKELNFLYYDTEYGEMLSKKEYNKLFAGGIKYNPKMELLDLYE